MNFGFAVTVATAAIVSATTAARPAQAAPAGEIALISEELAVLRARIEQLEKRLAQSAAATSAPPPVAAAPPPRLAVEWKGSPRFVEGDRAFKVKGRIQADANYVRAPAGLADDAFGFSSEFRRIRLGGEGKLGGGFGYKLELELSDNSVDLVDTFVTYERGPWLLTLGNQNPFQSLDELTGDTSGSFMERAAFTDAFNFERRLGLSAQYRRGALIAQLGVFTDDVGALANDSDGPEGGDENNSFGIDGRLVYAPKLGPTQLHFGASAHRRELGRLADAPIRYRQRPFVHSVNTRLIGTPALDTRQEDSYGFEFGLVRGRWHAAMEMHLFRAERASKIHSSFKGGYVEAGYFLTPDSRGYENGIFGAIKPNRSITQGGIGAVQLNLRYDALDLDSPTARGGTQDAYLVSLIWTPIQYLRFNVNYGYIDYTGATALADGRTSYGLHVVGSRFELDF